MPKNVIAPYTKADHLTAIKRGEKQKEAPTAVVHASYDESFASLVLELHNGARVVLPIDQMEELRNHAPEALATVEVSLGGKRSTTTKARASRRNGRKGGRPRSKAA